MRFVAVGHVARDEIDGIWRPGGSAYYGAAAAAKLGLEATIISRVGPNELEEFEGACARLGIRLIALPSPVTTTFAAGRRRTGPGKWRITARAPGIAGRDVTAALAAAGEVTPPSVQALLLGPIAREIAADVPRAFRGGARVLAAQGFLREWDSLGQIGPRYWAEPERFLSDVDAVVVSEEDIEGQPDTPGEWSQLAPVFVTQAERGVSLWRNGRSTLISGFPREAIDTVGAGDAFAAALTIAMGEGRPLLDAARFANAAASFAVSAPGASGLADRDSVLRLLRGDADAAPAEDERRPV